MKIKKFPSSIKKLWKYIRPHKAYLIFSLIFNLLGVVSSLISTVIIGKAIDCLAGYGKVDFNGLLTLLIYLGVTVGVYFISEYLQGHLTQKLAYLTVNGMRNDCVKRLNSVPLSYIDAHPKGDIISKIVTDVTEISDGLLTGFTSLVSGIVTILATLVIMLVLNYKIALVVIILTPISLISATAIARWSSNEFKRQAEVRGEMTAFTDEMLSNQKAVKAFLMEDGNQERFAKMNGELKKVSTKATFYSALSNPATRFVNNIIYVVVGAVGAMEVISHSVLFTVGSLASFLLYANKYTKPFNEISGVITELQSAVVSADRVFALIETPIETPDDINATEITPQGTVEIKDLNFSYDGEVQVLKDISLKAEKGSLIGIVGKTGSGKTTLINLLMRFYEVTDGEITIDGVLAKDITRNCLRRSFGMVLQDSWLFKGTVKENVAYGKPNATDEEIITACKRAYADGFIRRLENGYDTVIEENAENISEGQKQLLCIARVMLCLPPMLILDEATSSIDTRTETKIQKAFLEMSTGRTAFVVAHRLSTIKSADTIVVIEDGKIVEKGSHAYLLRKKGVYYGLYNSQFETT